MNAEESGGLWDELSLVEDWLGGAMRRERERPDFSALARAAAPARADAALPAARRAAEPVAMDGAAMDGSAMDGAARHDFLSSLERDVAACTACRLAAGRTRTVFGTGSEKPLVLVVGEGPGAEEDATGLPFVGPAGKLLDKMLAAIGLSREENVYIANIVKCRPPGNRDPAPDEAAACLSYLERQVDALAPRAILCLGRTAARTLTGAEEGITKLRGRWFEYRGIPLIATFHPSALLREESYKRPAWEDLKALKESLGDVRIP